MKQTGLPEEPAVGLRLHLLTLPVRDAKISLHSTGSLPHTKATTQFVTETAAETDMTAHIDAMIVTDVLTMIDLMTTTGLSGMAGVMIDLMRAADSITMIGSADAAEAPPPAAALLHQAETGIGSTAGMVPNMTAGLGTAVSSVMIDPIRTEAIRTVTGRQVTGVVRATGARTDSMTGMLVTEAEGLREHPAETGMMVSEAGAEVSNKIVESIKGATAVSVASIAQGAEVGVGTDPQARGEGVIVPLHLPLTCQMPLSHMVEIYL